MNKPKAFVFQCPSKVFQVHWQKKKKISMTLFVRGEIDLHVMSLAAFL